MALLSKLTPTEQQQLYQFILDKDGNVRKRKWTEAVKRRYQRDWLREKYHNDAEFREKTKARRKDWAKRNPEKIKAYYERIKERKRREQLIYVEEVEEV